MKTLNFELNRLDSCSFTIKTYIFAVSKVAGEFKALVSKTSSDGVSIEYYESKMYPTLRGASLFLNKKFKELV